MRINLTDEWLVFVLLYKKSDPCDFNLQSITDNAGLVVCIDLLRDVLMIFNVFCANKCRLIHEKIVN